MGVSVFAYRICNPFVGPVEWLHESVNEAARESQHEKPRGVEDTMRSPLKRKRHRPKLSDARMVLGFTGWMDGGDVSTGTVDYLIRTLRAREVATIEPSEFYIYNFPGSMEVSSLFRPHTSIENGLITEFEEPVNVFHCGEEHDLVLFQGKEPNLHWREYAECVFSVGDEYNVGMIYFVGSVAGSTPHTREPRIYSTFSDEGLAPLLQQHGLHPSNYEGPASFITHLLTLCNERGFGMMTLVAEIPAYVQGRNIRCIEAAARKLVEILGLPLDLGDLKILSDEFVRRVNETVKERPELAELIRKIEKDYDQENLDTQEDDLKAWFEKQDIRLD